MLHKNSQKYCKNSKKSRRELEELEEINKDVTKSGNASMVKLILHLIDQLNIKLKARKKEEEIKEKEEVVIHSIKVVVEGIKPFKTDVE